MLLYSLRSWQDIVVITTNRSFFFRSSHNKQREEAEVPDATRLQHPSARGCHFVNEMISSFRTTSTVMLRSPLRYLKDIVWLVLVPSIASSSSITNRQRCSHEYCEKQNAIFDWVEANGGYVNPNVEITTGPDPSWNIRGVFATAPIVRDEIIFRIPPNLMLCRDDFCDVVTALSHEISLGKASFWWPYLSILEDHELDLPYTWSQEERDLLVGLYPHDLETFTAHDLCNMLDMDDETILRASQLIFSRNVGFDIKHCMAPLFDSLNHAQREYINTEYKEDDEGNFLIHTLEDISKKQQLFDTFGDDSFNKLFRDYGFFSQYPRLWVFEDETGKQVSFKIFQREQGFDFNFNPNNEPHQKNIIYMHHAIKNHLSSVLANEPKGFTNKSTTFDSKRFETALAFRKEYINAFQMATDRTFQLVENHKKDREALSPCSHEYCEKQKAIFEWAEANGGYINPKVEITTGSDPSWNIRGVFATAPISKDETIFELPPNIVMCRTDFCDLVTALRDEISLGQSSFWWPYLSILEDHELDLPFIWAEEERGLLNGLYPGDLATSTVHDICDTLDINDKKSILAFQLANARCAESKNSYCMIPLFDSINHGQEGHENSALESINKGYLIQATHDINEKQQLFDTFGSNNFQRLFHDYGFFSQYPRLWVFEDETGTRVSFKIFQREGGYEFDFNPNNEPHQLNVIYMQHAINRHISLVLANEPKGFTNRSSNIQSKRYNIAFEFRKEYINAFQMAFDQLSELVVKHKKEKELVPPCSHEYCEKQKAIFEWVEANGGYINPNVEITTGPDLSWNIRGVFATAPIQKREKIFWIPPNLLLCRDDFCDLVAALSHEISLGNSSFWWPYLSILEDQELDLPYTWSNEERALLSGLYPSDLETTTAHEMCEMLDMSNETNIRAFQLVISRAGDGGLGGEDYTCMIPLYDVINHAQESYENSAFKGHFTKYLEVYAVDSIAEEQQLFDSFVDYSFYFLFQNYGIHSQYPQLWVFKDEIHNEEVSFLISELDNGSFDFDFNPKHVSYQNDLVYMHETISNHLSSVLASQPSGIKQKSPTVSSKRYEAALSFRQGYIRAFQMAADHLQELAYGGSEEVYKEEEEEEEEVVEEEEGGEGSFQENKDEEEEEEMEEDMWDEL
jgi:hypothetical protein